jgi:hypothetical protein
LTIYLGPALNFLAEAETGAIFIPMNLVKNLHENTQTSTIFRLIRGKPGTNTIGAIKYHLGTRTGTVKPHTLIGDDPTITLGRLAVFHCDALPWIESIAMGSCID